eukprot:COSAG05_NODE_5113_length_1260_cov_1.465978_1_plen_196_part_00
MNAAALGGGVSSGGGGPTVFDDGKIITQYSAHAPRPGGLMPATKSPREVLNPNSSIYGKEPGDVKRILARRDAQCLQVIQGDAEEFLVSWLGESDSLYTTWVPRSWLAKDGYAWGLLAAFDEKRELLRANMCAAKIQAIFRGRSGRHRATLKRNAKGEASRVEQEERARVKAEWEAKAAERAKNRYLVGNFKTYV